MAERPQIAVAVVMRRARVPGNRWQDWRWSLAEVLCDADAAALALDSAPRQLLAGAHEQRWLFPGLQVELFRDDAEGYWLNLNSPAPCWFVLWRCDDEAGADGLALARPVAVSLSYHDAGRWLDAQETVEQLPAPPAVLELLRAFVAAHYRPEPKRRKRPQSFRTLQDRFGRPASVSTDRYGGGGAAENGNG